MNLVHPGMVRAEFMIHSNSCAQFLTKSDCVDIRMFSPCKIPFFNIWTAEASGDLVLLPSLHVQLMSLGMSSKFIVHVAKFMYIFCSLNITSAPSSWGN